MHPVLHLNPSPGRTGRASSERQAMSLACIDELELHNPIERLAMYEIRRVVPGDRKRDLTVKAVPINDDMTIAARWITEGQMPTTLQTTITHTTLGRYRRQSGQHPGN